MFRSDADQAYSGRVVRLGREADRETREFIVDVRVLELPENWAVGQRAEVYIQTARKDEALVVPAKFVVLQARESGVFLSKDGRAQWQPIEIGFRSGDTIEITAGLQANETIVMSVDPRTPLTDGRRSSTQ